MTNLYLHHAFIDEAGSVAPSAQSNYLIIAALCTNNPRSIDRIVRWAQKKYGSSLLLGELKANKSSENWCRVYCIILRKKIWEFFSMIVDHGLLGHAQQEADEIYRWAASRLVRKLVQRFPRIEMNFRSILTTG